VLAQFARRRKVIVCHVRFEIEGCSPEENSASPPPYVKVAIKWHKAIAQQDRAKMPKRSANSRSLLLPVVPCVHLAERNQGRSLLAHYWLSGVERQDTGFGVGANAAWVDANRCILLRAESADADLIDRVRNR
jgi:hypothetical protein